MLDLGWQGALVLLLVLFLIGWLLRRLLGLGSNKGRADRGGDDGWSGTVMRNHRRGRRR